MTAEEFTLALNYLRPGASFRSGSHWTMVIWNDPSPQPTEAECIAALPAAKAAAEAEATNASIRDQLTTLDIRYGTRACSAAIDGDRTLLDWLNAEKDKLRAQFVGVSEAAKPADPEA